MKMLLNDTINNLLAFQVNKENPFENADVSRNPLDGILPYLKKEPFIVKGIRKTKKLILKDKMLF